MMILVWIGASLSSSPAKAGDPVTTRYSVITGCPAFAGHDGGKSERLYRDHALGLPFEQKAAAARLGTGQADRRNDSSRLSAVTLEPLRPRAAHVVQLRSIAAVRQDGSDGPENGHKVAPPFPPAIFPPHVVGGKCGPEVEGIWAPSGIRPRRRPFSPGAGP